MRIIKLLLKSPCLWNLEINYYMIKRVTILLFLVSIASGVAITTFSIYTSTKTIRQVADYTFAIRIITNIPSGGSIKVIFPTIFTQLPSGSNQCSISGVSSPSSVACSFSGQYVLITNCFPSSSNSGNTISFTINQITNPLSAVTSSSFIIYTLSASNNILDDMSSGMTATYDYISLKSASLIPGSQIAGAKSTWTINLETNYQTTQEIDVKFPYWNQNLNAPQASLTQFCNGAVTCTAVTNFSLSSTCICSNGILSIKGSSAAAGKIQILASGILNPPTTDTMSGFSVYTSLNSGVVEYYSGITVGVNLPNTLTVSSLSLQQTQINQMTTMSFSIQCSNPVPSGSILIVSLPSDFSITDDFSVDGVYGIAYSLSSSVSNNIITITNGFSSYLTALSAIQFEISNIKNPSSMKATGAINVLLKTNTYGLICETSTSYTLQSTSGNIKNVIITPLSYTINANTTYSFAFEPSDPIPQSGAIMVTAPSQISFTNSAISTCYNIISGLSPNAQCEVKSSKYLFITNAFSSDYSSGVLSFQLNNAVNPGTIQVSDPFIVETYTSSEFLYLIDYDASATITATSDSLKGVTIAPSSFTTGDITTYTFSINTRNTIPQGGGLKIVFPEEISIQDTTVKCQNAVGIDSSFTCTNTYNSITISNGFLSSSFQPGLISFTIGSIKNPGSLKASKSFQVFTSYSGLTIDSMTQGITIQMQTPHTLQASISSASYTVGETTSYTLKITPYNALPANSGLQIVPPSDLVILPSVQCEASGITAFTVSCALEGSSLIAELTFSAQVTSQFSLQISQIINPSSTKPTQSFGITTTSEGYSVDSLQSGLSIQMITPGKLNSASVFTQDTGISVTTDYTFTLELNHQVPTGGYVEIQIPSQITMTSNIKCKEIDYVQCEMAGNNILQIFLFGQSISSNLNFSVENLKNYQFTTASSPFVLTTKTSDGYSIDTINGNVIVFTCNSPCQECDTLPDSCVSCSPSSSTPYYWSNSCHSSCQPGWVDVDGSLNCIQCSSNCQTCSQSISNCSSCPTSLPYLKNGVCVSSCPSSYLTTSSKECLQCNSNCKTCGPDINTCKTCSSGMYLYKGTCINSCSAGVMITVGNACQDCSTNCKECIENINKCTSCNEGMFLYQDKCISKCPQNTTIIVGSSCVDCDNSCNTCSIATTNCTSCFDGFFLYENQCLSACPSGFGRIEDSCQKCSDNCKECSKTVDSCISCPENEYLYQGTCVNSCPQNTAIPVKNECVECITSCKTCSGSPDSCVECSSGYYFYQNQCISACPQGTIGISGSCESCDSNCYSCENSKTKCTGCSDSKILYKSSCYDSCPSSTIKIGNECLECDSSCLTCISSTKTCVTCANDLILYEGSCYDICPSGYQLYNSSCIAIGLLPDECSSGCGSAELKNTVCDPACNVKACNYDDELCLPAQNNTDSNNTDHDSSEKLSIGEVPFPATIVGVSSIVFAGVAKLTVGTLIMPTTVGVWGILETFSWGAIGISLIEVQDVKTRRRLMDISDFDANDIFFTLVIVFSLHICFNILFIALYHGYFTKIDKEHKMWIKNHKWTTTSITVLSVFSFKFMRLLYSCSPYKIKFGRSSTIYLPLIIFTFSSAILTTIPMLIILVYILYKYPIDNSIYSQTLDSLIISLLVAVLSLIESVLISYRIGKETLPHRALISISPEHTYDSMPMSADIATSRSGKKLLNLSEANNTINSELPSEFKDTNTNFESEMGETQSQIETNRAMFEKNEMSQSDISALDEFQIQPKDTKIFTMIEHDLELDLDTAVVDKNDPECISVFYKPGNKRVVVKQLFQNNTSIDLKNYTFMRCGAEAAYFMDKISHEEIEVRRNYKGGKIVDIEEDKKVYLIGRNVINEEQFDFNNGIVDENDFECVLVTHLPTGITVKIKKPFSGFPILDARTNLPTKSIVNSYDPSTINVNKSNIHFATLTIDGKTVKVRRNFKDAKIVDIYENTADIELDADSTFSGFEKNEDPLIALSESEIPSPRFSSENSTPFTLDMSFKGGDQEFSDVSFSRPSVDFEYSDSDTEIPKTPRAFTPEENKEAVEPWFMQKIFTRDSKAKDARDLVAEDIAENDGNAAIQVTPAVKSRKKKVKETLSLKELEDIKARRMNPKKLPPIKTVEKFRGPFLNQIDEEDATFGVIHIDENAADKDFDFLRIVPR
ncbi:unnamed protein product [Blepharisma stoltei]|uniref:EGF-like domain-containing protein n=1 Tax=Blepharisma stoltei TaxID=1481888 RepID=A0AAU9K909_9CILI|nr:unnamed protein product [Blepharisma stoltei]